MKNSRKSKKVSWAPGVNLVQVRSFQAENCPSQVWETQNRPKAKASCTLHSNCMESNDLPPGFEGYHSVNQLKEKPPFIPRLKWKCPPKFVTRCEWQVAAGEESKEAEAQKLREKTVLEAVYPRLYAIPPNPFIYLDIEDEHYNDSLTPLIPLTSTEEEFSQSNLAADVAAADLKTLKSIPIKSRPPVNPTTGLQPPPGFSQGLPASETPNTSECNTPAIEPPTSTKPAPGMLTGISADTIAAASAALTAIVKTNEPGSMIDTDLLVEILSNPKMIEKLTNDIGAPTTTNTVSAPLSKLQPISQSLPLATPKPDMVSIPRPTNGGYLGYVPNGVRPTLNSMLLQPVPLPRPDPAVVPTPRLPIENSHTVPNRLQPTSNIIKESSPAVLLSRPDPAVVPTPRLPIENLYVAPNRLQPQPAKDVNYYKNLIRQHGGEKEENKESHLLSQYIDHNNLLKGIPKSREVKPKIQKACMYFNSSKGCKNGTNCLYKHEISMQKRVGNMFEAQTAKRMRMGGKITGFGWI